MTLSNSDKFLVTSLANALHACVKAHDKKEQWTFHGVPLSWGVYSDICATLWKLNLARISNGSSGYLMDFHKYIEAPDMMQVTSKISIEGFYEAELVSSENIGSKISFANWGQHLNLTTIIEQFVFCMSNLGLTETLPVSRKSEFEITDVTLSLAMNELVIRGFAARQGNKYQWSDKIAVHMIGNYLWTQDEVIEARANPVAIANSLEKLLSQALNKVPYYSRGNISTITSLGMSIALLEHWDGNIWHNEVLGSPAITFENAMGIAKGFLNLYKPSTGSTNNEWSLKQHETLSENEKKLVLVLVKAFHQIWVKSISEHNEELVQGYAHHGFTNVFKGSAYALWVLELADAAWPSNNIYDITFEQYKAYYENPQNLGFLPYIKPIPKYKIDECVSFKNFYPTLSIFEILKDYLEMASDYGGTLSVDRHASFQATDSIGDKDLDVLVEHGYASKDGSNYFWTDKISMVMISNHYWGEKDFDPSCVDIEYVNFELSNILGHGINHIPRGFYDGYLGLNSDSVMGLTFGILRYWSGTNWTKDPLQLPSTSFDNAITLAREILKNYKHNDDWENHSWVRA